MSTAKAHRLEGLEPDNLLAFLALLGLLRVLGDSRHHWRPKASWAIDEPPLRPVLHTVSATSQAEVAAAAAEGLARLAATHEFPARSLQLSPEDARRELESAARAGGYRSRLWAALVSDKSKRENKEWVEPTPFCLMFGQGHQYFLDRLASVPQTPTPPPEGRGRSRREISEDTCLREALFVPWERPDPTNSFRWDAVEDVRYALRAVNPSTAKAKQRTQHGANRLAAIGIASLTVAPRRRGLETRLTVRGGAYRRGGFTFTWPIWRDAVSLTGLEALLCHPGLEDGAVQAALGVVELRKATRHSVGKFMNFTRGAQLLATNAPDRDGRPASARRSPGVRRS